MGERKTSLDTLTVYVVTGLVLKLAILILGMVFLLKKTIPTSMAVGMMLAPIISLAFIGLWLNF